MPFLLLRDAVAARRFVHTPIILVWHERFQLFELDAPALLPNADVQVAVVPAWGMAFDLFRAGFQYLAANIQPEHPSSRDVLGNRALRDERLPADSRAWGLGAFLRTS